MTCNHMCIFRHQMAAAPGTTCLLRSLEGMIRSGSWRPSCQVGRTRFIDGLMQSVNQGLSLSFREIYSQVHLVNVIMDRQFRVVPKKLTYLYSTSSVTLTLTITACVINFQTVLSFILLIDLQETIKQTLSLRNIILDKL